MASVPLPDATAAAATAPARPFGAMTASLMRAPGAPNMPEGAVAGGASVAEFSNMATVKEASDYHGG